MNIIGNFNIDRNERVGRFMKRTVKTDEFFNKQPDLLFLEDLKSPLHQEKVKTFGTGAAKDSEICAQGMYLVCDFPDEEGLLETAYDDFNVFLNTYALKGDRFPVTVRQGATDKFEEHLIEINDTGVTITANDTEGIRRGIYYLEDALIAAEGPFLPKGTTKRTPYIRKRITRGFFSPTNRPPKCGDELSDDIDYYDDNYLSRLAHDGTNGLWIYTNFFDIIPSAIIPEYGQGHEKRIAKLNRVCEKCARYGIGVYVFAIEPAAPTDEAIIKKHQDLLGTSSDNSEFQTTNGFRAFCTHTEKGRQFCIDATKKLCEMVPKLAGYMSITAGERITTCAAQAGNTCPHCGHIDRGEALSHTLDCLREGMRQSGSKAEFVSWTYGHRRWTDRDIVSYVEHAPEDVMLMQNFDDMGYQEQLGKVRQGVDYWLSYTGPSPMFEKTGEAAKKFGKHLYAKMQVCCSHEIATVPYIPVPGILFDKFKGARRLGVEGVVECWYFGNYPSIMSKAAGELAFWEDFSDKEAFLEHLSSIYSGRSTAKALCSAWNCFEEGYSKYPLNVMFSYYGPMHDSVCWQLYLKPRNFSLSRSWLLLDKPDGDRIYEALMCGHTLEEAITLTGQMSKSFTEGLQKLAGVPIPDEHLSVIKAIDTLFKSGCNILKFYKKREQLGLCDGNAKQLLQEMKALVSDEMVNSQNMITLCKQDGRLGYHSEAEGYKYFPEKIADRIEKLKKLLATEFPEIEERVAQGLVPLEYYQGIEEDSVRYQMHSGSIHDAPVQHLTDGASRFAVAYDDENLYIKVSGSTDFILSAEFQLMHPYPPIIIGKDGTATHDWMQATYYYSLFGEAYEKEQAKWKTSKLDDGILLTLNRADIGWTGNTPIKLSVKSGDALWIIEEYPVHTLGKKYISPGEFGWLIP